MIAWLLRRIIRMCNDGAISIAVHGVKKDLFENLAARYGIKSKLYGTVIQTVCDEAHQKESFRTADIELYGVKITLYSKHFDNPNYTDEAAKAHCKEQRERRIEQAKRDLEFLPKVNCETEGSML